MADETDLAMPVVQSGNRMPLADFCPAVGVVSATHIPGAGFSILSTVTFPLAVTLNSSWT